MVVGSRWWAEARGECRNTRNASTTKPLLWQTAQGVHATTHEKTMSTSSKYHIEHEGACVRLLGDESNDGQGGCDGQGKGSGARQLGAG
eukprot:8633729-Alexandrium_andersonii.AAC.1